MSDPKMTTTDGRDVDAVRAEQQAEGNKLHASYIVLTEEERARGFVRPVRQSYRHDGPRGPVYELRDLTPEEQVRYAQFNYAKFEVFPESESPKSGRFWTQVDLDAIGKGCGATTTMSLAIAETYARDPAFYGSTYCATCGKHFPVGERGEFTWNGSAERVGT